MDRWKEHIIVVSIHNLSMINIHRLTFTTLHFKSLLFASKQHTVFSKNGVLLAATPYAVVECFDAFLHTLTDIYPLYISLALLFRILHLPSYPQPELSDDGWLVHVVHLLYAAILSHSELSSREVASSG